MKIISKFLHLAVLFFLVIPQGVLAKGAGFVPAGGIWFSTDTFLPKETVRVYTVIVNNNYFSLEAQVNFYDNGELIDAAEIHGLPKEAAKVVRVFWQPTEGRHIVSARLLKAVATDESGKRTELSLADLTSVPGIPLMVVGSSASPPPLITESTALGATTVAIKREGDKFFITALDKRGVEGEKIAGSGVANTEEASATSSSGNNTQDFFKKNREALDKLRGVAAGVTGTASAVGQAYGESKSFLEKGKELYETSRKFTDKLQPFFDKVVSGWMVISGNNNPKRVVLIVGGSVVAWLALRRSRRSRRYFGR